MRVYSARPNMIRVISYFMKDGKLVTQVNYKINYKKGECL